MKRDEIGLMVDELKIASKESKVVNLSEIVGELIEGMVCRMLFGKKHDDGFVFKTIIGKSMEATEKFNIADYVPTLAPFDLQEGLFMRRVKGLSPQDFQCVSMYHPLKHLRRVLLHLVMQLLMYLSSLKLIRMPPIEEVNTIHHGIRGDLLKRSILFIMAFVAIFPRFHRCFSVFVLDYQAFCIESSIENLDVLK